MIVLPYLLHDLKLINLKQTSRQGDMEYALYGKSKVRMQVNCSKPSGCRGIACNAVNIHDWI